MVPHVIPANPTKGIADSDAAFLDDVLSGLQQPEKQLPCKYLYDQYGSQLFDRITELPEYYLTRTENQLMQEHAESMAESLGRGAIVVEFGSGNSLKTRSLLSALEAPKAYVPVDVSREYLIKAAAQLAEEYPEIAVYPVAADFAEQVPMPEAARPPRDIGVYFPGSTIGNFTHPAAIELLSKIATRIAPGRGLLIGVDLQKEPAIIEAAYNDAQGITAAFSLNLLRRINRELGADFDLAAFTHLARYDEAAGRVEIYLVSRCDQNVQIHGRSIRLFAGERILTEYSHKYSIPGFADLAAQAGWTLTRHWVDPAEYFAVLHFHCRTPCEGTS